jgi:hypothetical protein
MRFISKGIGLFYIFLLISGCVVSLLVTWLLLAQIAAVLFGVIYWAFRIRDQSRVLKLGLFLAFFDFAFENLGAFANLWVSKQSVFPILAVPAEIFVVALLAGGAYALIFPPKFDLKTAALVAVPIAIAGTLIEALMISQGALEYSAPWTPYLALPAYWSAFILVGYANSRL